MGNHWKELLPIDHYQVRSNGLMHDFYRKTLTSLYQPLIGAVAYSLYMTLWSQLENEQDWSERATHRSLMNITQLDLKEILLARKKLEGIGLLTTYVKEENGERSYLYQLEVPMSPDNFFNDGALNVYLYNRLGNHQFQQLKRKFTTTTHVEGFTLITAAFNEVYDSLHPSEMRTTESSEISQAMELEEGSAYLKEKTGSSISIAEDFDMEWLEQSLSDLIVPKDALNAEMKDTIKKLVYIYNIEPLQMKQLIESTYVKYDELSAEALRKSTHEWYAVQHQNKLPHLSLRIQPPMYKQQKKKQAETEEEKAMELFESISPYEQLEKMAGGAKPAASDIKIIEGIMFEQNLNPGVVNVLIDYVMRTNDMKMVKAYIEKIAAHWARKNIKTVSEAMALAKSEHRKYQEWSKPATARKKAYSAKNERKDKLPKWMTENKQEPVQDLSDFEQQKRQLEARLKKYSD
ncbi:Replication initiation and membrane attachment protein [Pueribacillus theae]|uniref:Replication initiation and membrane attachment protein n=1 Tax=Pueribacillus theae TaxID=2171751 RepID=A0A2U1K4J9_9BACI|nr:DnaD domain protein [Pueribacillus theae]PWA12322.1 Replication initiation and membrane attachment protein [Pueribacillus theae]